MKLLLSLTVVAVLMGLVLGLGMPGLAGALLLGCAALGSDCCLFRLRFQLIQRIRTNWMAFLVVSVFLLRLLNAIIFVRIGFWFLNDDVKTIFSIILAAVPFVNLGIVYRLINSIF